jgi:adenine deaminase
LRRAIALGMMPMQALQATTINPARRLRLFDRGFIGPGRRADLLLVDSLEQFNVSTVVSAGRMVVDEGQMRWQAPAGHSGLDALRDSLELSPVTADLFLPDLPRTTGAVEVRVIVSHAPGTTTEEGNALIEVVDGVPQLEGTDLSLIAVLARGNMGYFAGFLRNLGLQRGAVATSHAHDSHNLAVIGRDRQSMATAANAVIDAEGGIAVAVGNELRALVPLPIAGIISDLSVAVVAAQMRHVTQALAELGVHHPYLLMRLSTYTLPVSGGLRITDMGYVRARERALASLVV